MTERQQSERARHESDGADRHDIDRHDTEPYIAETYTAEPPRPPAPRVTDTASVHRLGRGVRWSDIVAMIERDRLASEAARREAA